MSSSDYLGTQRAALDKAGEGWCLLSAADYDGAIASCTEAIELDPSSLGARQTRAEAFNRLGKGKEAEADLNHLDYSRERDEKRDPRPAFCARLRSFGVDARPGEVVCHGKLTEWLIDVTEGPIRQVLIWEIFEQAMSEGPDEAERGIAVRYSRIEPDSLPFPHLEPYSRIGPFPRPDRPVTLSVHEWPEIGCPDKR